MEIYPIVNNLPHHELTIQCDLNCSYNKVIELLKSRIQSIYNEHDLFLVDHQPLIPIDASFVITEGSKILQSPKSPSNFRLFSKMNENDKTLITVFADFFDQPKMGISFKVFRTKESFEKNKLDDKDCVVFIKTPIGTTVSIEYHSNDLLMDLKARYIYATSIDPYETIRLIWAGRPLDNDFKTLADYGMIKRHATIHDVLNLRGGMYHYSSGCRLIKAHFKIKSAQSWETLSLTEGSKLEDIFF